MANPPAIMLLDDQPDWLRINCNALKGAGLNCEPFTDRRKALDALLATPDRYSLVLIDVNLGGHPDGIAVARKFLEIKPSLNLVLISTQAQLQGRDKDLEEIAQTTGLKYFRKKGDVEGGQQVVKIAKQYLVAIPRTVKRSEPHSLSTGAMQTWLEADEKAVENEQ